MTRFSPSAHRRHEEARPNTGSATPHHALSPQRAAVAGERRDAGQGRDLLVAHRPELG